MLNTSQELKGMKTYQNYLAEQREKTWRRDREKEKPLIVNVCVFLLLHYTVISPFRNAHAQHSLTL